MLDEHVFSYLDAKFMSPAPTRTDTTMRKEHCYLQYSYEPWSAHRCLEMVFDTLLTLLRAEDGNLRTVLWFPYFERVPGNFKMMN